MNDQRLWMTFVGYLHLQNVLSLRNDRCAERGKREEKMIESIKKEEATENIKAKQWTKKQSHKFFKQECLHHPQRIASRENLLWQRKVQKRKPSSNGRGNQSGEKKEPFIPDSRPYINGEGQNIRFGSCNRLLC